MDSDIYIKKTLCKCAKCGSMAMQSYTLNTEYIEAEKQLAYNEGYNKGYNKAKAELRKKLGL